MTRIITFLLLAGSLLSSLSWAQAIDKKYDVKRYIADISLDRKTTSIVGKTTTLAVYTQGVSPVIIHHAKGFVIDSVFVNGIRSQIEWIDTAVGEYQVIGYGDVLDNDTTFSLITFYHGIMTNEGGATPWGGVSNDGSMMFAMGVGFKAPYISCTRHWLPCYDLPDDKADDITLSFTTDSSDIVASVGSLITTTDIPNTPLRTYSWRSSHPIATYLMTFAVGPFHRIETQNPLNIPFETYALTQDTANVRPVMSKNTVDALVYFDSLFRPYPFSKVGYVAAPIGSMEHQTMITLDRRTLDTNSTTTVHELAHMWWGDHITCYDFNDPWLNEGFATYCEALYLERFKGIDEYWKKHRSNISGAINSGSAIPLYGTPLTTKPASNYPTGVLYQKGAAVLGMLRYFIGDEKFFNAVRLYSNNHSYNTATSYDLWNDFETSTGSDLDWFFTKWVFGIGFPRLETGWSHNDKDITVYIAQKQDAEKQGYFRLPLVIEVRTTSGESERHTVWLDSTSLTSASFSASFIPDTLIIDPDRAVIRQLVGGAKLGTAIDMNLMNKPLSLIFRPNPIGTTSLLIIIEPSKELSAKLDNAEPQLTVFDPVGAQIGVFPLRTYTLPSTGMAYELELPPLSSGTYFASLVLNGSVIGTGQFVVQK